MKPKSQAVIVGLFLICSCLPARSLFSQHRQRIQFDPIVEQEFKEALRRYVARDYLHARQKFEALAASPRVHHRMTATLLMAGKSLYKQGRYADSLPYFGRLLSAFPQSSYADDSYYARGAAHYRLGQYVEAARDFLWVAGNSREQRLVTRSSKLSSYLMRKKLSGKELEGLLPYADGEVPSALVSIALATYEMQVGANDYALEILTNHRRRYGGPGKYAGQVERLIQQAKADGLRAGKVGVILPLSGYFREEGLGVLRGIQFARSQRNKGTHKPARLVVRDSESSMVKAVLSAKDLIAHERVPAIIGDLESDITAGMGALAAERNVTVLAPAATENGVASVGATVFQLNSDLERKGEALAEYAIKALGMQTFVTLAPSDAYGHQMVASFSATVDRLGGRIISQSWYYGTPEDLGRQFKSIREAAFAYDSTDVELMIEEAEEKGETLRERDIPVLSVDGFFIPIYSEDIKYVAPQLAQHNIRTQILGGEYLDDLETLKKQQIQPYINGVIFVSDYFPDENNRDFRTFRSEFRLQMKKTPERWEVFGYDAYNLVENAMENGATTGSGISRQLEKLDGYRGKKGLISFEGNNRINRDVNILQFIDGKIIKHEN